MIADIQGNVVKRGRPVGSRNRVSVARGARGASSAAAMNSRNGVVPSYVRVYVAGEGWVRWAEIAAQVKAAHAAWLARCQAAGRRVVDGFDLMYAGIEESMARRGRE